MRVISGSRRRIILEAPEGMDTRPTQDRIKETLFNMIGPNLYDSRFLDIFAGSGQMGIEALSRGASFACFIENDKKAINCIKNNLIKTKFNADSNSYLITQDVFAALNSIANLDPFDYIFMDPPYNKLLEKQVLEKLYTYSFVNEYTEIIVEASLDTRFDYLDEIGFVLVKSKEYKTNKHVFIRKR